MIFDRIFGASKNLRFFECIDFRALNKIGRNYHAVSPEMEKLIGIKGPIQRSIPPRMIEDPKCVENLKKLLKI